jgi:hypothetical protein
MNANLVITRAGRRSLHAEWLHPETARNFDLLVLEYEPGRRPDVMPRGVQYLERPGSKVAGYAAILGEMPDLLSRYERIALVDDDIRCSAVDLSRLFVTGERLRLDLWQPSLSWDSYFTYAALLHNPFFAARRVNFIEMMCPFFSRDALRRIAPTLGLGFESGIDLVWPGILGGAAARCAVIDSVQVVHTRPVGGQKHLNGFEGRHYEDDIHRCLAAFNGHWPSAVCIEGVLADDRVLCDRPALALRTLQSLAMAYRHHGRVEGARPYLIHARHQLMRQAYYVADAEATLQRWAGLPVDRTRLASPARANP